MVVKRKVTTTLMDVSLVHMYVSPAHVHIIFMKESNISYKGKMQDIKQLERRQMEERIKEVRSSEQARLYF